MRKSVIESGVLMVLTICLLTIGILEVRAETSGWGPRNIILFVGDGLGYYHVDASSYFQYGEKGKQPYEGFPVVLAMSTYQHGGSYDPNRAATDFEYVKHGATDSAAAATALSSGYKTRGGMIGVDPDGNPLLNPIQACAKIGRRSGVVSSVQFSHATPAGFVAHNRSRGNMSEIAREMILEAPIDLIMGVGHPFFDNDGNLRDGDADYNCVGGADLWKSVMEGTAGSGDRGTWTLIHAREDFQRLGSGPVPRRVLGVPQVAATLQQSRSGQSKIPFDVPFNQNVPSLIEMTRAALNVLNNGEQGFFLMVEGGAIDWASHGNQSARMVEETIDFNLSIGVAVDWVEKFSSWDDTLIIVTADHETGYLTGPDTDSLIRPLQFTYFGTLPLMAWHSGGHTNSLVPLYARGNGSQLLNEAATKNDIVRGRYLDNTDVGAVVLSLLSE